MLYTTVLVDAPWLFSATWKMVSPVLDDRVRQKINYCSYATLADKMAPRLGSRMVDWILKEMDTVRQPGQEKRMYWAVPKSPEEHDSRGDFLYVSDRSIYIETPGDAWAKRQ
jgi:hypothetical protein